MVTSDQTWKLFSTSLGHVADAGSPKDASGRIAGSEHHALARHAAKANHRNAAFSSHPFTQGGSNTNAPLWKGNLFKIKKTYPNSQSLCSPTAAGAPTPVLMKADTSRHNSPIKEHPRHHPPLPLPLLVGCWGRSSPSPCSVPCGPAARRPAAKPNSHPC